MILWFDVEDLVQFAGSSLRPSGIQRLAFEIYRGLQEAYGASGRIRFLRHAPGASGFVGVDWSDIETMFEAVATSQTIVGPPVRSQPSAGRRLIRYGLTFVPQRVRGPAVLIAVLQVQALWALCRAVAHVICAPLRFRRRSRSGEAASAGRTVPSPDRADMQAGDVLLVLGSPWFHQSYASLVARARYRSGIRFAVLLHDVIPMRYPEWCDAPLTKLFRDWYGSVLPLCDIVFTNSACTAADLKRFVAGHAIPLSAGLRQLPIGTSFGAARVTTPTGGRNPALPPAGSYVLMVSTIEVRKNHEFLFRVWRSLLEERGPASVPSLVLVGRVGWLVADFMKQLENTAYLDGRIRLLTDVADGDLRQLYEGCLFTVFSSLYEGWGLPVTESLALGKPCFTSDRGALPEAGGTLARYFDPEDLASAVALIGTALDDPADLAAWQARVQKDFRPVSWQASAAAIVEAVDALWPVSHDER